MKTIKFQIVLLGSYIMVPQTNFCGWAYKVDNCIWNFMPISKNREKRRSIIEVQITK